MEYLKQSTIIVFWALIGAFIVVLAELFIPAFENLFKDSKLFLIPMAVFSLLGLVLLILILKEKIAGKLKKFLMLTGASATGFFVFVFLHNFIYGVFIYFFGPDFWEKIGTGGDEPFFFLLAVVVCPIGFLVGVIGSIILLIKNRKKRDGFLVE